MPSLRLRRPAAWLRGAPVLLTAACLAGSAAGADAPLRLGVSEQARFVCAADVVARTLTCQPLVPGRASALHLTPARASAAEGLWTASMAVQSRPSHPVPLGDVAVRLLGTPQTTRGTGAVRASGDVLAAYAGVLAPGRTTTGQPWRFAVDPGVEAFSVQVAVVGAAILSPLTVSTTPVPRGVVGDVDSTARVVRTARGVRMPMQELGTWSSSDPSVATVDADGRVTRVGIGSSLITYSVGGRAVQQTAVQVCPQLAVGEVIHFTEAQATAICLNGTGTGASEYTLIASNQSRVTSASVSVTATGIQAATGPPAPVAGRVVDAMTAGDAPEMDAGGPGDAGVLTRLPDGLRSARGAAFPMRPVPAVGDSITLKTPLSCTGPVAERRGGVRAITDHAIIVFDGQNPPYTPNTSPFRPDSLARWFEGIAWPAITPNVGTPTDLDGNGRVIVFVTRAVNELSPPASSAVTFGYMTPVDLVDPATCPNSNGGEIVYMLAPDPTGAVNSNVRTESLVTGNAPRTMGIELTRLALHGKRLHTLGSDTFEEPWLESALMGMAEDLMFYQLGSTIGLAPRTNITLSTLTTGTFASRRVAAFNTYANSGFTRFRPFLQRPDTTGMMRSINSTAARGVGWAFLRYALDRVNGSDATVLQTIAGGQMATGQENLRLALGLASVEELEQWYRDFLVATYTDDAVTGVTTRYTHPSWNYRSVYGGLGGFPLLARPLANSTPLTLSFRPGGSATYYRFGIASDGAATVTTGDAAPARFSLVRTK